MKKSIKFISLVLALGMCFSAIPVAHAAVFLCENNNCVNTVSVHGTLCDECQAALDNQQNGTEDGENKVDVSLTVGETWTVKIPKTITLNAETKSADYTVQVSGNIAGTKQIKVAPDASFLMKQDGKDDITAEITQTKQAVASGEIEDGTVVEISGSIAAPDATSGEWTGSFNFEIALEDAPKLITFEVETIADGSFQAEEGMTWEEWLNSEYNTKGFSITEYGISAGDGTGGVLRIQSTSAEVKISDKIIANEVYDTGAPDL